MAVAVIGVRHWSLLLGWVVRLLLRVPLGRLLRC